MTRFGRTMLTVSLILGLTAPAALVAQDEQHKPTTEVAHDLVAPPTQHQANRNQIDIVHHIGNAHEVEIPFVGVFELPRFAPIHVGNFAIDLSPTKHLVFMLLSAVLVTLIFTLSARSVARAQAQGRPARGFAGAMEATALYIRQEVILPNVGHHGEGFVPYLLTLFFFILAMNLLGLLPWGATATGNIAVTAALALMAFVTIEIAGMRALGARGYLNTIFYLPPGLPTALKPIMLIIMTPVEIIGKLSKPFALAVRLFANMTAGHVLVLALIGLTFLFQSYVVGIGASVLATAIMLLELFVAFLQAFVFTLLTSVFIGLMRAEH
ncbi:MAG TPA: F0F1 ATP synthase subunit A [Gemmatimonadales bacterium]|nr:F0F1 ATP synthase subunit A [Gemmatimonadales bacterium]